MPAFFWKYAIACGSVIVPVAKADVDADPRRAVAHQMNHLFARAGIVVVQPFAHQHLFAVECPAFGEDAVVLRRGARNPDCDTRT